MEELERLQAEIAKAINAAQKGVELASKETLPYELSKYLTLEEFGDANFDETPYMPEVLKLEFQLRVCQKSNFADRMIQSISEVMALTGKYDSRILGLMGIRDACEIAKTLINKTLGH